MEGGQRRSKSLYAIALQHFESASQTELPVGPRQLRSVIPFAVAERIVGVVTLVRIRHHIGDLDGADLPVACKASSRGPRGIRQRLFEIEEVRKGCELAERRVIR